MKKIIIFVLMSVVCMSVSAQENRFEFSIHAAGGSSTFKFNPNVGETPTLFQSPALGGNIGLTGSYFFTPQIGLRTGFEAGIYRSEYTNPLLEAKGNLGEIITRVEQTDYSEQYKSYYVNIPLMLQLQTAGDKNKLYVAVGGKIGIPINDTFEAKTSNATMYTKGSANVNMPDISTSADLSLKTALFAAAEAGMKWKLSDKSSLYTAFYLDLGLNDTKKAGDSQALVYIDNGEYKQNSIVNASYSDKNGKQVKTEKFAPFAAGVKVAFSFGLGSKERSKKIEVVHGGYIAPKKTENRAQIIDNSKEELKTVPPVVVKDDPEIAERRRQMEEEYAAKQAQAEAMADVWEIHRRGEEEAQKFRETKARKTAEVKIEMKVLGYKKGQTTLTEIHKKQLDEKVLELNKYPDIKILCTGHTCDIGTDEVNRRVGLGRAEAAKQYLISKGIDSSRIQVETKGKNEALLPNTDEENRLRNRRIEFRIIGEEENEA